MRHSTALSNSYFVLAFIGVIWSWAHFIEHFQTADSWLVGPFLQSAMATPASSGVAVDAFVTAIVFSVMAVTGAERDKIKWPWAYVAACFLIGVCLALPAYLGMRERALNKNALAQSNQH